MKLFSGRKSFYGSPTNKFYAINYIYILLKKIPTLAFFVTNSGDLLKTFKKKYKQI